MDASCNCGHGAAVFAERSAPQKCILTGEIGDQVKPYHLLSLATSSTTLRRLEYHWGIPKGHLDPNVSKNTVPSRHDLHRAFDSGGFALVPSLRVMRHISKQFQAEFRTHLSGVADMESYRSVCPPGEYEYLFVPLRWSSILAGSPNLPAPCQSPSPSLNNPPSTRPVAYFPPYPPHAPLSFLPIQSLRAHPYFLLARWLSINIAQHHETFTTLLGGDYDRIVFELLVIDNIWSRGGTPPPYNAASFLCSDADVRSEGSSESPPPDTSPSESEHEAPQPIRGKRSRLCPTSPPRPRKFPRLTDAAEPSRVSLWLSQLPTSPNELFEPEAARDVQTVRYGKERAKEPGRVQGWKTWNADWVKRPADGKVKPIKPKPKPKSLGKKGGRVRRALTELE